MHLSNFIATFITSAAVADGLYFHIVPFTAVDIYNPTPSHRVDFTVNNPDAVYEQGGSDAATCTLKWYILHRQPNPTSSSSMLTENPIKGTPQTSPPAGPNAPVAQVPTTPASPPPPATPARTTSPSTSGRATATNWGTIITPPYLSLLQQEERDLLVRRTTRVKSVRLLRMGKVLIRGLSSFMGVRCRRVRFARGVVLYVDGREG